jgi:hypothetical protein
MEAWRGTTRRLSMKLVEFLRVHKKLPSTSSSFLARKSVERLSSRRTLPRQALGQLEHPLPRQALGQLEPLLPRPPLDLPLRPLLDPPELLPLLLARSPLRPLLLLTVSISPTPCSLTLLELELPVTSQLMSSWLPIRVETLLATKFSMDGPPRRSMEISAGSLSKPVMSASLMKSWRLASNLVKKGTSSLLPVLMRRLRSLYPSSWVYHHLEETPS